MKNIMILRHFKTSKQTGIEKIDFVEACQKTGIFVKKIIQYVEKYKIKKIQFYTSDYERTQITALLLANDLKDKIIEKKIKLTVSNPVIDDDCQRDPTKKNKEILCQKFKQKLDNFDEKTLYIFITHSSVIGNVFKCLISELGNGKSQNTFDEHIHDYSFSSITKNNAKISYKFNKNIG